MPKKKTPVKKSSPKKAAPKQPTPKKPVKNTITSKAKRTIPSARKRRVKT